LRRGSSVGGSELTAPAPATASTQAVRSATARGSRTRGSARGSQALPSSAASKRRDRKSTRLNSSHSQISYAVFCLKKKKINRCKHYVPDDNKDPYHYEFL